MVTKKLYLLLVAMCMAVTALPQQQTFTNPLLPSGADPWSLYKDGYYYYTNSMQDSIVIWKTKNLAFLATAEKKTIFIPPAKSAYAKELWAPEIHFINNKWYVYFAADDGDNNNHHMYVLENKSRDPFKGKWKLKGKLADKSEDKWAIDGSVFKYKGSSYFVWSGWKGNKNGQQDIFISKMKNPWTLSGGRVRISSPTLTWERDGDLNDPENPPHVDVNEGPQPLMHNDQLFMIYSASGCWTDSYALGMLTFSGNNLLDSAAWKKSTVPVFKKSVENGVYAPGHNSFFKSPDGKQDWILYHANDEAGQGCGWHRSPRAQPFTWNADGTPNFGEPMKAGVAIPIPSQTQ